MTPSPLTTPDVHRRLLTCALLMLGGCYRTAKPPAAAPVKVAAQKPATVELEVPRPPAALEEVVTSDQTSSSDTPSTDTPPPDPTPQSPPPFNPAAVERFVLFTPRLPLIIELELLIDGKPHTEALASLVDEVLKVGDTDGDGRTLWKEVTESKRFKYGQFGNLPFDRQNGPKQITEQYDLDRDGVFDREEAPRFLTRNAGSSRPFSLRGTTDWRDLNHRDSPTWEVIDSDQDGVLSAQELAAISTRLRSRDQDDDDLLSVADFRSTTQPGMDTPRRRLRGPDANRLLGPHAAWERIQMDMEKIYALGGRLKRDDLPLAADLMALLDVDGNGSISAKEYPRLNDAPSHVRIRLSLGGPAKTVDDDEAKSAEAPKELSEASLDSIDEPQPAARNVLQIVEVIPAAQALGVTAESIGERLEINVPGMRITMVVNDTIGSADFEARAKQALTLYDADKNGYLEASEIPEPAQAQFGRFEVVDADEDGKVYAGEIAHYLSHQQAALRAQIHAKAEDVQDAVFPVLDEDRDGRLVGREIESAGQRLLAFDKNGDGQIDPSELPGAMLVVFARGSLENRDQLFQAPAPAPARRTEGVPKWFTRLDENGDGAISPREFLGDAEQFQSLDKDRDGFISVQEIE